MTRSEAIEFLTMMERAYIPVTVGAAKELVHKIFNSIEDKTCSNCKYREPVLGDTKIWCRGNTPLVDIQGLALPKDFCCNKWASDDYIDEKGE